MVDRQGLEFEAAGPVQGVDALLDGRVHHAAADVLVHRVIGEAQIVLVGQAGEAVGRRLDEELLRQAKLTAQGDDLLGGVHPQGGEGTGAVAVDGAVAYPVLAEVAGVDDDAALYGLGHGVQGGHADAAGQIDLRLAAGGQARLLHLVQHALNGVVDVDGGVGQVQVLHQCLGVVDVRLDAVGHEDAEDVFAAIGGHGQGGHGGAVLAAGDADDGGLAVAGIHLLGHPLQQAGQLYLGVEFHVRYLPFRSFDVLLYRVGEDFARAIPAGPLHPPASGRAGAPG